MTEFQVMVNKMTNWQRNQWAKAGYPGAARGPKHKLGQADESIELLRPFLKLNKLDLPGGREEKI